MADGVREKKDRIRLARFTPRRADFSNLQFADNYQGEESDIVVVSLCRYNTFKVIGFMGSVRLLPPR